MIEEMKACFRAGFSYAALTIALSLPDICSALEIERPQDSHPGKGAAPRYKHWCRTYLAKRFSRFSAEDCWGLRGGVLHNGKLHGHQSLGYERVVLMIDPRGAIRIESKTRSGDKHFLYLDLHSLIDKIADAAEEWYAIKRDDEVVSRQLDHLIQYRSEVHPFAGLPAIY